MERDTRPGAAVYNRATLLAYDFWVLGVSNRYAWACPTEALVGHFENHASGRHLDIGVGSGALLQRARFPVDHPEVVLADLNPASLAAAARRIRHLGPRTHQVDVMRPFRLPGPPFASVSMNYLLHCLPGSLADKAPALRHAAAQLRPGGTLFGATILGEGVRHNPFGRALMGLYNARGIFSNRQDSVESLQAVLAPVLDEVEIQVIGRVALFAGRKPR